MSNIESVGFVPSDDQPTTENDRLIVWEKWHDPFGQDADQTEWPGAHGTFATDKIIQTSQHHHSQQEEWEEEEFEPEDYEAAQVEHQRQNMKQNRIMMITTPMGVVPITEHTRAGSLFNFWTAHTNFRITKEILEILDNTDGVETLDIHTPYRWRIAIGKAFSAPEVKKGIQDALSVTPRSTTEDEQE